MGNVTGTLSDNQKLLIDTRININFTKMRYNDKKIYIYLTGSNEGIDYLIAMNYDISTEIAKITYANKCEGEDVNIINNGNNIYSNISNFLHICIREQSIYDELIYHDDEGIKYVNIEDKKEKEIKVNNVFYPERMSWSEYNDKYLFLFYKDLIEIMDIDTVGRSESDFIEFSSDIIDHTIIDQTPLQHSFIVSKDDKTMDIFNYKDKLTTHKIKTNEKVNNLSWNSKKKLLCCTPLNSNKVLIYDIR
jgi:hypothetical protein